MFLNVCIPRMQSPEGVAAFFQFHRGYKFASSALMDPISKGFISQKSDARRLRPSVDAVRTWVAPIMITERAPQRSAARKPISPPSPSPAARAATAAAAARAAAGR